MRFFTLISIKQKALLILALGAISIAVCSFVTHKFYVSKTTVAYNNRLSGFEVTCRFFTDDLEKAIGGTDSAPIRLGTDKESSDADQRIEKYITDHFKISFEQQPVLMRYIGKELENDMTFCYFEFIRPQEYHVAKIESTLFFEMYPEQQNLVDLTANGNTQTAVLLNGKSEQVFFR